MDVVDPTQVDSLRACKEGLLEDLSGIDLPGFFDTGAYLGPRTIRNDPTVILEWALMADGVAREDVYATLETDVGVPQALKKMDTIKSDLQIWESARLPVRLLNAGEVAMSSIWATPGATASMVQISPSIWMAA